MSFSFGSTTTPSTGGFSFGAAAPAASTAPASSGFSFGAAPAATTSATSGGFSFGATPAATTAPAPAAGGFSFGSTATPSTASATTGGFSFGSTAAPSATAAPSTGGFSFGSTATTAAPSTGGFSFGSTPSTGGFGFGSSTTTPATGGFGFGSTPSTGGFGFGTTPAPGTAAVPPAPQFNLYSPSPSGAMPPLSNNSNILSQADPVISRINALSAKLDISSEHCELQTVMYNLVDPALLPYLTRPIHANIQLWQEAVDQNPDPSRLAPCLVVGFDDLEVRVAEQIKTIAIQEAAAQSLAEQVEGLRQHYSNVQKTIEEYLKIQKSLLKRLFVARSDIEVAALRGTSLLASEIDYINRIESVETHIRGRDGLEDQVIEICTIAEKIELEQQEKEDRIQGGGISTNTSASNIMSNKTNISSKSSNITPTVGMKQDLTQDSNSSLDENSIDTIYEILDANFTTIKQLDTEIEFAKKDLYVICHGIEKNTKMQHQKQ